MEKARPKGIINFDLVYAQVENYCGKLKSASRINLYLKGPKRFFKLKAMTDGSGLIWTKVL
jgi:hypothetical protein